MKEALAQAKEDEDCAMLLHPTIGLPIIKTNDGPAIEDGARVLADDGTFCYMCVLPCFGVIVVGAGCKRKLVAKGDSGDSIYAVSTDPAGDVSRVVTTY